MHMHMHIYIYICVCVCVCLYKVRSWNCLVVECPLIFKEMCLITYYPEKSIGRVKIGDYSQSLVSVGAVKRHWTVSAARLSTPFFFLRFLCSLQSKHRKESIRIIATSKVPSRATCLQYETRQHKQEHDSTP